MVLENCPPPPTQKKTQGVHSVCRILTNIQNTKAWQSGKSIAPLCPLCNWLKIKVRLYDSSPD